MSSSEYDAVIVGSGPNGLSAAIHLAREGFSTCVIEQHEQPGGGVRTEEGPLPDFYHDVCAAVMPMAVCSPFFRQIGLRDYGVEWAFPEIDIAHPLDNGEAALMYSSIDKTVANFSAKDAKAYRRLFEPLIKGSDRLFDDLLQAPGLPRDWLGVMKFGLKILPSAESLARKLFEEDIPRALFAGSAAHSVLPLNRPITSSSIGVMLMLAGHRAGWPIAKGGAGTITEALIKCLKENGGELRCGELVKSFDQLPKAKVYLFDTGPHAMANIAGDELPSGFRNRLLKFQYGPGVFKVDYALSEPVPWKAQGCRKAGTVHAGGTLEQVAEAEQEVWDGKISEKPFVLASQPSVFDSSRAPDGKHTLWAYCHVPANSEVDMSEAIERQIERFAPGFRDTILDRKKRNCADFQRHNPNYVGGDVVGGMVTLQQLMTRPVARIDPHTTPNPKIYICSSSTPPGGGVHGMCGFLAAKAALRKLRKVAG